MRKLFILACLSIVGCKNITAPAVVYKIDMSTSYSNDSPVIYEYTIRSSSFLLDGGYYSIKTTKKYAIGDTIIK